MTEQQLYDYLVSKNPRWKTDGANLTANGLRKLIKTAYSEGAKGAASEPKQHSDAYNHLFDTMFGDKKR
jgi:hypothetical protein